MYAYAQTLPLLQIGMANARNGSLNRYNGIEFLVFVILYNGVK